MKTIAIVAIVGFASACVLAQPPADADIAALIKQLGSANPKTRTAATDVLKKRPEAVPVLRDALKSNDLETARRAAEILKYHSNRELRELETIVNEAPFNRVVDAILAWPAGKDEEEFWYIVRGWARKLVNHHEDKGGAKIKSFSLASVRLPFFNAAQRIDDSVKGKTDNCNFLRCREVDLDFRRPRAELNRSNWFDMYPFVVSSGPVSIFSAEQPVIFAGGSVELELVELKNSVVVTSGNLNIKGDVVHSLLIARGTISCSNIVGDCRLISGKSTKTKREPIDCLISENDSNPLGIIRWDDAPKAKEKQKSK